MILYDGNSDNGKNKIIDPDSTADQRVADLKMTSRMLSATFYTVPQELMPLVHQPTHRALDDLHLNTKIPTTVLLSLENFYQIKGGIGSGFGRRLEQQLALLKTMPEPRELKAESLSDNRLGNAIVRRKKDAAEVWRLLIAQENRLKARRNTGYDA